MGKAVENVAVAYVRGRVPEFEVRFAQLLAEEGYWDLGSIQTFSELAQWLNGLDDDDLRARTIEAVEFIRSSNSMRHGTEEVAEFFEALAHA